MWRQQYRALAFWFIVVSFVMSTRLLIVDDQPNARELIRGFLTMPGVTFHECGSGHDAVAAAQEFKPHWVTMDIKMPGLDGFETTKALKQSHPDARVLIVTSFNDPHFRDLAHSAGAAGFILKENLLALRLMLERETKNTVEPSGISANVHQPGHLLSKRILILDDDKEIRTMLGPLLAGEGYHVTYANNGAEAISLHRQDPYALVVIELLLPNNMGFETLSELRRTALQPKFIATAKSSWMPPEIYSKMAKQLGVHGTLAKPYLPEQLLAAVKNVLDR
jgi:CheY-like chemotaxis protein